MKIKDLKTLIKVLDGMDKKANMGFKFYDYLFNFFFKMMPFVHIVLYYVFLCIYPYYVFGTFGKNDVINLIYVVFSLFWFIPTIFTVLKYFDKLSSYPLFDNNSKDSLFKMLESSTCESKSLFKVRTIKPSLFVKIFFSFSILKFLYVKRNEIEKQKDNVNFMKRCVDRLYTYPKLKEYKNSFKNENNSDSINVKEIYNKFKNMLKWFEIELDFSLIDALIEEIEVERG